MNVALSEEMTKYHGQKVKTAVVSIPGKGRVALTLSDTARCARMPDAARRTLINLAGGEEAFDGDGDIDRNAEELHKHCQRLQGIGERKPLR